MAITINSKFVKFNYVKYRTVEGKDGPQPYVREDIAEILDNTEEFYFTYNQTTREKVYRELRKIDRELKIAYMFSYYIKNIGVIKCADENIVRIINKEKMV